MKYYREESYFSASAWRGTKSMDGGGALMNQGIHGVDLLQYIAGMPVRVFGQSRTLVHDIEVEDTLHAMLMYENGALGIGMRFFVRHSEPLPPRRDPEA